MGKPGRPPKTTDEEFMEIIQSIEDPIFGTYEISEHLGYSLNGTKQRLDALVEKGVLCSKELGGSTGYWLPERVD